MPGVARFLDPVFCKADIHPPLPPPLGVAVPVTGQFTAGSPDTFSEDRPVVRVGDGGVHAACPGPNTFTAVAGSPTYFVNDKPAVRGGDMTLHCGLSPGEVLAAGVSLTFFAD